MYDCKAAYGLTATAVRPLATVSHHHNQDTNCKVSIRYRDAILLTEKYHSSAVTNHTLDSG